MKRIRRSETRPQTTDADTPSLALSAIHTVLSRKASRFSLVLGKINARLGMRDMRGVRSVNGVLEEVVERGWKAVGSARY